MLRHYRGMLHIAPHSDPRDVTHFMCGGIVVTLRLPFPCDPNIVEGAAAGADEAIPAKSRAG